MTLDLDFYVMLLRFPMLSIAQIRNICEEGEWREEKEVTSQFPPSLTQIPLESSSLLDHELLFPFEQWNWKHEICKYSFDC